MSAAVSPEAGSPWSRLGTSALGALVGGLVGGALVVVVTLGLKAGLDFVSGQPTWARIVIPLVGLALAVLVLQGYGLTGSGLTHPWREFPPGTIRADITGDVVDCAGEEERLPWRLTPIRVVAIFATVGFGGAMGTEAPAAYLGDAVGVCLCDRRGWLRRLIRYAGVGGGAAGVAALMGIPLVGTGYMLELGRRHKAPLSPERVLAALIGGFLGWGINVFFNLNLIRLVVPHEPPRSFPQAVITVLFIGALSGAITAFAGSAIYRAKKWDARPIVRFGVAGLVTLLTALALVWVASPLVAVGPGGGAITWAENNSALPSTLLAVALLRAVATTAAVAAGGCGGVFVPFLAIGDIAGRVFAPSLGIGDDLAGSAGAAGGIAGGYRLPFTAVAMVLGVGGPRLATLTGLATVAVAFLAGIGADAVIERFREFPQRFRRLRTH